MQGKLQGASPPFPAHVCLTKVFLNSQSLWKILKTFLIIENTRNIAGIVFILQVVALRSPTKNQVGWEGALGVDWATLLA
jgi:hypothetical protein